MTEARESILIVDDEEIVRRMVADVLSMAGYATRTFDRAEEALTVLRREGAQMVITDNNLPGMQGLDLLREIRAEDAYLYLPVILMTAYGSIDTSIRAHELGADGFLLKPFDDIDVIVQEVETVLARVARRRALDSGATPPTTFRGNKGHA